MKDNLRQVTHDHTAQTATRHDGTAYPGNMAGDTAAQLFALLTGTALAYLMETRAGLAGPGPGQSLATAGLPVKDALLAVPGEKPGLKNDDPAMAPASGRLAWRTANGEDHTRP